MTLEEIVKNPIYWTLKERDKVWKKELTQIIRQFAGSDYPLIRNWSDVNNAIEYILQKNEKQKEQ
mgnify:CR=1 FL=1